MKYLKTTWIIAMMVILSALSLQARTAYPSETDFCVRYISITAGGVTTTVKLQLCYCMDYFKVNLAENGGDFYGETCVKDYNTIATVCELNKTPRQTNEIKSCRKTQDCFK